MTLLFHSFFTVVMWQMCTVAQKEGEKLKAFLALIISAANGAMVMLEILRT